MPPKKKTAAKAKVAETPAKSSMRSTGRAAPESFAAHGVEHASTAAASRPTRTITKAEPIVPSTAPGKVAPQKLAPSTVRNIGLNVAIPANVQPSKKRGRPAAVSADEEPPKKRGRPAKAATVEKPPKQRGAGRPVKSVAAPVATGKKRGLPAKAKTDADAVGPEDQQATPRKRGAGPKGGETTKIESDDEDAAEQLEEELLDAADKAADADTTSKPKKTAPKTGRPAKGKARKADSGGEAAAAMGNVEHAASGKQFWLMKAEQDGHEAKLKNGNVFNTKFTIDDLRAKTTPEPWDGVRNPTAAKNMRAMKRGDLAFFYASGGKVPAIVGVMEIVKEHEPDQTAWDEAAYGYVEKDNQRNRWCVVHVEFRKKFNEPVTRATLMKHKIGDGALSSMQEFTAARLSVSKVTEAEWRFINSLLDEDDQYLPPNPSVHTAYVMVPNAAKG